MLAIWLGEIRVSSHQIANPVLEPVVPTFTQMNLQAQMLLMLLGRGLGEVHHVRRSNLQVHM
jgi:hypothetical protein